MRFCFLASRDWVHPEAAGGDYYLSNLARGLASRGHRVVYLASSFDGHSSVVKIDGVEVRRMRPGPFYAIRLFQEYLRVRNSVDVIVEEIFGGKKTPALARFYAGRRLVAVWYQRHDKIFAEQYPWGIARMLSLGETLLAKFYREYPVVTLSNKSALEISEIGIDPANIGIVPSAALMEFPKREDLPPFDEREDTMIFIGKIRKYKRVDHTIMALRKLRDTRRQTRLIIAGNVAEDDADYLARLRSLSRQLRVERLVDFKIFPGAIPSKEKVSLLKRCKVLLQPSPVEGFSMTTVEANACGTPVVVSDGVPPDAVVDGVNGLVYPFGNIEAMTNSCGLLLEDPVLWKKVSINGLKMAQRFNWKATTDAFEGFCMDARARTSMS